MAEAADANAAAAAAAAAAAPASMLLMRLPHPSSRGSIGQLELVRTSCFEYEASEVAMVIF